MDRRDLPFFALAERYFFVDLLLVLYPLPGFLAFPSSPPFAPIDPGWLFLTVLF